MLQFLPRRVPSRGLGDRKRALDSPPIEPGRRIVELEIQLPLALRDEGPLRPACVAAFAKARRRKDDIVRVAEPRANGDWRRFGEEGPAHPVSAVALRETPAIAFSKQWSAPLAFLQVRCDFLFHPCRYVERRWVHHPELQRRLGWLVPRRVQQGRDDRLLVLRRSAVDLHNALPLRPRAKVSADD